MPVTGWPTSVEFIDYKNSQSLEGSSDSYYALVCGADDFIAVRTQLFDSIDSTDPTLYCVSVEYGFLNDDWTNGKYRVVAHFIPFWKFRSLLPNEPFYVYMNFSSQDITLPSKAWSWASGNPINNQISPIKTIAIVDITLKGARTGVDLGTYSSYGDMVNNDVFLGKAAGYVIFKTAAVSPRMLNTGVLTNDVELRLQSRNIPWNQFFNEDTGLFEEVRDPSGNPMFASTAFAGLLT